MKRFHNFIFTGCVFLLIAVSIFISSCQVGLGGTVDYKAPTVTITSHTSGNSVLNGTTEFSGTWEDDTGVTEIDFTLSKYLKDSQTYEEVDTFKISIPSAETEKKSGSWSYEFDTTKYPETDYQLAIVATDTSKTKSQQQILAFSIDNTAPLITLDKPNSLNFNDPALFGREVKISGYIEDAHSIKSLDVKVFKANADGSKGEEITLPKSSFSVSSGALTKYIARYYSDDARADLSDEELLTYENYVAIYGDKNSSNWNKNQNYIFEISATDKVGNVTDKLYLNDNLKSLIKAATDKDIELSTTEMRNILEDNYTDNALTESQVAVVKEILKGTYDQSSLSETYTYLVNNEDSLYGTINSRANPTYTANGCILGESTWGQVSSGGTLLFTVNSGSDGAYFKPNVINLALYPCDEDGNIIDKVDGTTIYRKIEVPQDYIKNSNNKSNKSIKDLETTVNTGSYSFSLTDMSDSEGDSLFKAGEYYKIEVTGYDLKNNDIIASFDSDDNEYEFGFKVIASNAMPEVTFANDKEFVKADDIANTIPVTISVSKAKKVVVSAYAQTKEGKCTFGDAIVTEGTKVIDSKEYALTDGVVTVNVPLNFDVTKLERGKNWTIGIYIVATNIDATKYETFYVYADDAAPEVAFKGKLLTAQKNNYEIGLITEADSLYEKDEKGNCTYTYTGTWSDIGGSGTDILYYSTDNGKTWSEFDSDEAPQATSKLGWTKALPVTEGGPYTLSFKAKDSVGNPSDVITFTGEYFDFAAPTITIEGDKKAYRNDATAPVFTITAEDTNALSALDVVVKKNGTAVDSGNGYTLTKNTDDTKKFTAKVITTEEAEWTIEATAKDCQNRTASIDALSFVYDKTAPKWYEDSTNYVTVDGKKWNAGVENWYNATAMTFKGFLEESVSGIAKVNYVIQPAGTTDEASQISGSVVTTAVKDKAALSYYEATLSGLVSGTEANTVTFTPVDKAGNPGTEKKFSIYVDNKTPKLESDVSGTKYTDGKTAVTLTGTVEDDDSGFAADSVVITAGSTNVTATLDTTSEGYSKNKAKWTAEIPADALADNKATDIYATVTDRAKMEITNKLCIYYVDTTAPVVNFKGKLDSALKNSNVVGLITEEDAPDGKFTVSGSWSDVNGSGTSKLYYKFDTDANWNEFGTSEAPTSDSLMNWTKELTVEQGTAERTLSFYAEDKVGNPSDVITFTGIKFDFALPEVKITSGTVADYYKEGDTPEFTVEATDTNKISALNLTVTKDGATVAADDYATAGITVKETTTDNKITKVITLTEDGSWNITAQAVDSTKRESSTPEKISTIFDTKKPVWKEDKDFVPKVGGNRYTTATWYNSTSLQFSGYYTEEGSGIKYIEYELYEAGSDVAKTSSTFTTSDKGSYESFEATLSGFIASNSANKVVFTPVDKAGNRGDSKEFEIHVDCSSPTISVDSSSQGNKYAQQNEPITLTGTIRDDASGFNSGSVKVKVGNITESAVNVIVDTSSEGYSSTNAKWTATIPTSVLSSLTENEPTGVTVYVSDAAINTSSTTACTIIIDTKKPEISFKNRLGKAVSSGVQSDGTYKVGLITKSDSLNYDSENKKFTYEISGDWTDNKGSGTKLLEYCIDGGDWKEFNETEAPVSSGKTNWSKTLEVKESKKDEAMTLAFRATDGAGLVSDIVTFTDIRFDYESPALSVDKSEIYNYYTADTGAPEFTITAEDTNAIESFEITVTKDGVEVSSGDGYTLVKDTTSTTTQTAKITVSEEAKWSVKTNVADCQGQKSELDTIAFVYDKTAPAWTDEGDTYYTTVGGKKYDSTNPWYKESAMNFKGYVDEAGSGIEKIVWTLTSASGSSDSGEIVATKVDGTDKYSYTQAISGFVSGTNTVTLTPVDKAGNEGKPKEFTIKVDNTSPVIGTADVSGTMYTKADSDISISGTITDTNGSGFTAGVGNVVVNLKVGDTVTAVNASVDATGTSAKWTATIPADDLSKTAATEITLSVKDNAGNPADQKLCTYYVDTTAPALNFKGDLLTAQSNSNKVGLITENNAAVSYDKTNSKYTYTLNGSWSDIGGSKTKTLHYKFAEPANLKSTTWTDLTTTEAPQSDTLSNWSTTIDVTESTVAKSLSFYAEDAAGNPTDEVTFTDLTFDFSVPTISITDTVADYYNKTPTFTITAVDGNEFNVDDALTVTATKDGSTVTSGYTLTKVISTDKKTVTGTLILNDEGKWSITVSAKDAAGRPSTQTVNINTTVDKTAPTWLEDSTHTPTVGGKDWNTDTEATENHSWFKSSSLKFEGYFTESGSGIKEIKWSLTPAGASTATKGTITASDKGTYEAFATTIDGFTAGENTITFTPVDYAGNEPATGKQFTIYIDDVAPDYSLTDSTAILTNKVTPVTLTGTATDANSGIDSVIVSITGITDASVTAILTDGSSTGEKNWSAEFNKTVLAKLEDGKSYSIKVTVEDKAENEVSTTATSISVDTTAPVVTISTPVSTTSLNGNHALSGKVTETSPKSLELYWSTTNDTTLKTDGTLDTAIWTKFHSATELSGIYNWTTSSLNFTDISKAKSADDGKATVYILPVAKDSAGNCNIYTYDGTTYTSNIADQRIAYTVDMNTDRPVIKFNELEKVSGTLRKYTNQISGTLSDDDTVTAFKIYATTDSADTGIPKTLAEWNSYTQEGKLDWTADSSTTSFTYEPNHITKDGTIYVYFFVTDSEGDSFFTGATSTLSQPYVMYKGTTANVDNSAVITYTTDSKQPQISSKAYYAGDDEDAVNAAATSDAEEIKTTAITIGGAKKKFIKFIVTASDDNGIKSVTGKVNSVELTFTKQSSTETTTTSTWISKAVSVASVTSGQYTAEITVTDNSDLTYPDTISVTVDNDGPEFGKINPSMTAVQVGDVSVSGFLSDKYSSVSTLKYLIGTDTVIGYDDDTIYSTAMADNTQYNAGSVEAFEFDFDNSEGSGESTHTGYKNPKLPTTVAELASYTQSTTDNQIYDIPIYFVAEDELGNYTVYKDFYVHYNPYADRPTTEILYPSNGATLSGQIRLSGSAVDNEEVGSVYYQIMPTSSSTYTTWKAAKAWATSLGLTVVDSSSTELSGGNFDADSDFWGIKATNTVSWYANLNDEVSLIKDECKDADSKNYLITVRAVAIDAKKTLGNWSNVVNIVLNPDAPAFGSIEAATLKQFADSVTNFTTATATSSLEISGTTYLKGQWYYVTTVTHTNGIKEISYSLDDSSSVALVKAKTIQNSNTVKAIGGESDNYSGYQIWIPLGTDSGSGTKTLTVSATTGNDVSGQKTEVFTYDNEAPEIGSLYHTDVDTEFTAGAVLTNNNNQLVIGGTVDDTTAGIDKVLFYFYREGTDTIELAKRIYDPMFNNYDATSKAKSEILTSTLSSEDITTSIPLYGITQTVNVGQDSKTLTLATESDHIRAGGLAKINGIYYTISKVDGTTVTLKTSCGVTGSLSAFFPIAQVVDNTSAEKVSKFTTDAITFTGNTDDGDGMPESLTGTGTTKTWEASIHGNWLPDGPVTLVVIAFDKSGNASATSINASIQNNRPRLSKVFLGTNLDGSTDNDNATYSDNEFETYNILAAEGAYQEVYELTTYNYKKYAANGTEINSTRSAFIAKNKLAVVPEFVGGNGEIKVIFNNADTTTDADGKMTNEDVSTGGAGPVYALAAKKGTLSGTEVSGDYFEFGTELGDDADSHAVSFTFWDSTELTTPGTDSQYSFLRIKDLKVAQTDNTAPNVVVNPFFWEGTGKGKNSLYEGSTSNGHIELEDDWMATDAYDKSTSGEYDGDPKVSGKIVLRGTAYDDRAFAGLYFKVTNSSGISVFTATGTTTEELSGTNYYLGATYANSTWTSKSSDLATNGWAMTIDSADNAADETYNYFGQNGHKVHWELALDTEKITGVAATDITVTVAAVDTKSNNSTGRAASDATDDATAHKPGYKMDVVPYITSLDTVLTDLEATNPSVYGRTALGKYPVYYYRKTTSGSTNAESFYVKGFNLSKGTVTFKSASTATDILDDNNAVSVPATAKSGEISVTVNGVQSLNNVNNDNAKGNYSGEYTDDDYAYCYNRQPNGQNNNNLTDNVELAIWDINSKAAVAKAGELSEVVMHVNPANGMLGFAFAHSQDLASYPNGTTSSYQTWITDWTGINQIGFTFDQTGRMFGTNGGTDTYTPSSKAGRFGLISSDWGTITTVSASDDSLSGYTNKNRLRLEYLGIKRNGTYASYSNRFAKGDCSQFATVVPASNSNVTNLYMMYYDNVLGQLKFKAGQYSKTSGWNWTGFAQGGNSFGDFVDDAYNEHCKDNSTAYNPNYSNLSIVSTVAAGANGNENATPGAYYSIAAVPSADGKSDVVVAVWYDVTHKNLWYSYIKNPLDNAGKRTSSGIYDADTYVSSEWAEPKLILDKTSKITGGAGGYCAIAVDEDKHVHIAAYGAKGAGRLYYVYLDTYDAKFDSTKNIVQVDSYGSTGQYITMEVAKDSNGKNIPYIGFWMNSMSYPKYTYLVDTDSATDDGSYYPKAGTDANSMYTGAWESIMLPTSSEVLLDDINIGVYRYLADDATSGAKKGQIREIPALTRETCGDTKGNAGGNGTANPILGYGISEIGSGYVETAQLK